MNIALHDSEGLKFPNLALMKLSTWHRVVLRDNVEWFNPDKEYDIIYSSKVFTFTDEDPLLPEKTIKGGTGYRNSAVLPDHVMACCPDYQLYDIDYSMGFLTRGCIRKCKGCFVPEKEGGIAPCDKVEDFVFHKEVVLMDNNVLAHPHGISQIERLIELEVKVDFNQGLDARLIDGSMAKLLAKLKWRSPLRLACDNQSMKEPVRKAVELLRWHNCTPRQYFCYTLVEDVEEALDRVKFLKGIYVDPFAQPFRDVEGTKPPADQRAFARFVNEKRIFKSSTWEDYEYNPLNRKKSSCSIQ